MMDDISYKVIGAAIEVHKTLGPGLLESIYENALHYELSLLGFEVQRQVQVPVFYKNVIIKDSLCIDLLINKNFIVEVKATEKDNPVFLSQILTYLKITNIKLGLLINFGKITLKEGIFRVVNNF